MGRLGGLLGGHAELCTKECDGIFQFKKSRAVMWGKGRSRSLSWKLKSFHRIVSRLWFIRCKIGTIVLFLLVFSCSLERPRLFSPLSLCMCCSFCQEYLFQSFPMFPHHAHKSASGRDFLDYFTQVAASILELLLHYFLSYFYVYYILKMLIAFKNDLFICLLADYP